MISPKTLEILNGPSWQGPIFGLFMVLIFLVSNQTRLPSLNGVNVLVFWSDIFLMASSCAAIASSLSLIIDCSCCSTDGYLVFWNVIGIDFGASPSINSNGDHFLSACLLLLCVNSIM